MLDFLKQFGSALPEIGWDVAMVRMGVAAALGGLIGFERETHEKPAGVRTHMMVALASCLFAILALEMVQLDLLETEHVQADPIRLIEAVTAGVAFLAAGSIINAQGSVRGLTTGAGLWMAGAIGVGCGLGQFLLAGFAAVISLFVLWILGKLT